jgi:FkbH-like protein
MVITETKESYPEIVERVNATSGAALEFKDQVRVRWLRNCTIEPVEAYLRYYLYKEQIGCSVTFGGFDSIRQDLTTPAAQDPAFQHAATVLAIHGDFGFLRGEELLRSADATVAYLTELFDEAGERCPHRVIVNTWIPPIHVLKMPGGSQVENCVQAANGFVRDYVRKHPAKFALADWERLARNLGESDTFDYRFLYSAKAPFTKRFLQLLAFDIARVLRLEFGRVKKALVLDCDGTLWGGILGEDGPGGVQLDPWEYPGNIYYRFHETVMALRENGVLVCLCSKNEERDLLDFMESNPHCLIKQKHLAAWRVNWRNKAENIASLAAELNLGLDSLVFVDDSAVECALVREMLPMVAVLQVPERRYELPDLLARHGLFDFIATTPEDRDRTAMYQAEMHRRKAQASFRDLEDYLSDLQLTAEVREALPSDLPRIAQLTQKTNQFNLTTIRYAEAELEEMLRSQRAAVFCLRPSDRFGDYGITGVLIARLDGRVGCVDSFLMSCRILERRFEFIFLAEVMRSLEARWPIDEWRAAYIPTAKNKIVAGFWEGVGFHRLDQNEDRERFATLPGTWRLPCRTDFITIKRV